MTFGAVDSADNSIVVTGIARGLETCSENIMKKIEFNGYLIVYLTDNLFGRWRGSFAVLKNRAEVSRGSLPLQARSAEDAESELLAAAKRCMAHPLAA